MLEIIEARGRVGFFRRRRLPCSLGARLRFLFGGYASRLGALCPLEVRRCLLRHPFARGMLTVIRLRDCADLQVRRLFIGLHPRVLGSFGVRSRRAFRSAREVEFRCRFLGGLLASGVHSVLDLRVSIGDRGGLLVVRRGGDERRSIGDRISLMAWRRRRIACARRCLRRCAGVSRRRLRPAFVAWSSFRFCGRWGGGHGRLRGSLFLYIQHPMTMGRRRSIRGKIADSQDNRAPNEDETGKRQRDQTLGCHYFDLL